ncbi:MAG: hypothetical protein J6I84_03215 [Bacilli bacterium]|nr:hypothetical protein [Bacilli bacterium]
MDITEDLYLKLIYLGYKGKPISHEALFWLGRKYNLSYAVISENNDNRLEREVLIFQEGDLIGKSIICCSSREVNPTVVCVIVNRFKCEEGVITGPYSEVLNEPWT